MGLKKRAWAAFDDRFIVQLAQGPSTAKHPGVRSRGAGPPPSLPVEGLGWRRRLRSEHDDHASYDLHHQLVEF